MDPLHTRMCDPRHFKSELYYRKRYIYIYICSSGIVTEDIVFCLWLSRQPCWMMILIIIGLKPLDGKINGFHLSRFGLKQHSLPITSLCQEKGQHTWDRYEKEPASWCADDLVGEWILPGFILNLGVFHKASSHFNSFHLENLKHQYLSMLSALMLPARVLLQREHRGLSTYFLFERESSSFQYFRKYREISKLSATTTVDIARTLG